MEADNAAAPAPTADQAEVAGPSAAPGQSAAAEQKAHLYEAVSTQRDKVLDAFAGQRASVLKAVADQRAAALAPIHTVRATQAKRAASAGLVPNDPAGLTPALDLNSAIVGGADRRQSSLKLRNLLASDIVGLIRALVTAEVRV